MPIADTTTVIIGAILGPIAGAIGSRVKTWVEMRDARGRARQLMQEAGDLLEFADKVQRSADSGGVVTKVPEDSLDCLHTAVVHKIDEVAVAFSPGGAARAREQHASRSMLGRIFLSVRPKSARAWLLHSLYYMMLGITVLMGGALAHDLYVKAANREGGVIAVGFFLLVTVLLNIFADAADHPLKQAVAPPPPGQEDPGKLRGSAA